MWINARLTTYLQCNYSTDDNKKTPKWLWLTCIQLLVVWKHELLVILQNFFHCGSTQPCGASLSLHYNGNRRRQLYWSNVMDWPLPPNYKKRPMYWSTCAPGFFLLPSCIESIMRTQPFYMIGHFFLEAIVSSMFIDLYSIYERMSFSTKWVASLVYLSNFSV